MRVRISIKCDNAVFDEGNNGAEVARILRDIADRIADRALLECRAFPLHDGNGNKVGNYDVIGR